MKKSKTVSCIAVFLLGAIISGIIFICLATASLTNLLAGDMLGAEMYPMAHVLQMIHDYNTAETYWPLLRYNQQFTQRKNDLEKILHILQSKPAVTIFFAPSSSNNDVSSLTKEIQAIHGVTKVKFVSKEDALQIYKQQNKNDPLLLSLVTADILPASLEVYVSDQAAKSQIETLAKSKPFVHQVIKSLDY